jgi:hypothetical protein
MDISTIMLSFIVMLLEVQARFKFTRDRYSLFSNLLKKKIFHFKNSFKLLVRTIKFL